MTFLICSTLTGGAATGLNITAGGEKFNRITHVAGQSSAGMFFRSNDEPAAGFGLYLMGYGGAGDWLLFKVNDGVQQQFSVPASTQPGVLFVGFVSDAYFREVTFQWEIPRVSAIRSRLSM